MPTLDWSDYRKPPNISAAEHKAISAPAFAAQRENIGKLCRALRPRSVVCMGAGYLNDIPLDILVANNTDLYLVEWIDGITEQSFCHDLVKKIDQRYVCPICQCTPDPKKYCQRYEKRGNSPSFFSIAPTQTDNCDNFVRSDAEAGPLCANYVPASFPRYLNADVTRGVAERFARQAAVILRDAKKPQRALREAIHISAHPRADVPLPLADHSIDFITSSMVVSQFDFEPYTYFVRNLYLHFGREELERNGDTIDTLAATLRNNLFLKQTEAHCREISRLLKPDGRAYFSIEVLHRERPSDHWFYAEVACKALEIVAHHFLFDLDTLPEIVVPTRNEMVRGGTSIVQSFLLTRKPS